MTNTKKTLLLLAAATMLLASCGSKNMIDEVRTFDKNVWNRFKPEVFNLDVKNIDNYYDIEITVSIDTAVYRYEDMPLTVNIYSPNSERRMFYANVPFKQNGRWRGEVIDGYRTVTQHIRTFFSFNSKGEHTMEVGQATSQYDLEGIHSMGVHIYKVDLDYPDL